MVRLTDDSLRQVANIAEWMKDKTRGEPYGGRDGAKEQAKPWPEPLDEVAYYGVLGTVVKETERFIETDSAALLVNYLVASGVAMGRGPYLESGVGEQHAVLYTITVAASGENKTDSSAPVRKVMQLANELGDQPFQTDVSIQFSPRVFGGLSTGEGLLWQMRDPRYETRQNKQTHETETVMTDPGVTDKRSLILESEFARVLAVMYRESNTLSTNLRDLFDSPYQAFSNPKNNAIVVTEPHVGFIGQITPVELSRKLHEVELYNGYVNRFMPTMPRRIKSFPNPPSYAEVAERHAKMWRDAVSKATRVGQVFRHHKAGAQWEDVYESLRTGERDGIAPRQGMTAEACSRGHVMVMRMSLIFAALDGSDFITLEHQTAALAIWDYCERCAAYLFGDLTSDPVENTVADAIKKHGKMTRTAIRDLFGRHLDPKIIGIALESLEKRGMIRREDVKTAGRSAETWEWIAA